MKSIQKCTKSLIKNKTIFTLKIYIAEHKVLVLDISMQCIRMECSVWHIISMQKGIRLFPIVLVKLAYYAPSNPGFSPKLCSNYAHFSKLSRLDLKMLGFICKKDKQNNAGFLLTKVSHKHIKL